MPLTSSSPSSGAWKPARILISVDLPEPFSPRSPWISPRWIVMSTESSARAPPKVFDSPRSAMTGASPTGADAPEGAPAAGSSRDRSP